MADHYTPRVFPFSFAIPALVIPGQRFGIGRAVKGDILRSVGAFLPDLHITGYIAAQDSNYPLLALNSVDGGWAQFRPTGDYTPIATSVLLDFVVDEVVIPVVETTPVTGNLVLDRQPVDGFLPITPPAPIDPDPSGRLDYLYSAEMQYAKSAGRTSFQDGVRHINVNVKADLFTRRLVDNVHGNVLNNKPVYVSRLLRRDRLTSVVIGLEKIPIPSEGLAVCIGTLRDPGKFFAGRVVTPSLSFFAELKIRQAMTTELTQDVDVYLFLPEAESLAQVPGETVFGRISYVRN